MIMRLFPLLSLFSVAAILLGYTGPGNRTNIAQTVVVRTQCLSTQYVGFPPVWRYRDWDGVYALPGSPDALLWQSTYPYAPDGAVCHRGLDGQYGWGEKTVVLGSYAPVSFAQSLACATPGNAGWCRGGLTQTLTASEPIPGYAVRFFETAGGVICDPADAASVTCSRAITQQGAMRESAWAVSSFGDTSLMQWTDWMLDTGLPANTTTLPSPTGLNDWHKAAVSVSISGADSVSGIDPEGYRYRINSEAWQSGTSFAITADGVYSIETEVRDVAGNPSSQAAVIRLDQTPPTVSIPARPDGNHGWYVTHPTITLAASDATSGIAIALFDGYGTDTLTLPDGVHPLTAIAQDMAGNTWAASETVRVDTQPPTLDPAMPAPAAGGWHTSAVTLTANASDSISGLALVEYRLDGGPWQAGSSVSAASEGSHTVEFRATDNAGGQAVSLPQSFRIDATPPVSAFSSPPDGATVRVSGVFTFSGASADALSGLASAEISLDGGQTWQPLTLDGGRWSYSWDTRQIPDGAYTILVRADDIAGNRDNTAHVQVIVANAPPRIELEKWWWLWDSGRLRVREGDIPIQSVTVQISCAPHHQDVTLRYTAETLPDDIRWDRRCGEGAYAAESGDYPVTATVCDAWGRCQTASGFIRVPFFAPDIPASTPMPAPEAVIQPPAARPAVIPPAVIPTASPITAPIAEPAPAISVKSGLPGTAPAWWHLSAIAGLLVFAVISLSDPRPRAVLRLAESVRKIRKIGENR